MFAFVSAPADTRLLPPIPCSLGYNEIGDEGASALAAVLKETMITNLKYAPAPQSVRFVSAPIDKKANTLRQPLSDPAHAPPACVPLIPLLCDHSVCYNTITGDAADRLATVVLEHAIMTDFCRIPLTSLRENSITELDLERRGVGVPGVIVLSKLLSSAAALTSLKYSCAA